MDPDQTALLDQSGRITIVRINDGILNLVRLFYCFELSESVDPDQTALMDQSGQDPHQQNHRRCMKS